MKRSKAILIGLTALVVAAGGLAVAAPTSSYAASGSHMVMAKKKYCNQIKNPIARKRCGGVKPRAILAQALVNARAAAAAYNACRPKSSAHCQALLEQAKAAIAQYEALARQLGSPAVVFPLTGAGGTAPVAGVAGSVVGIPASGTASVSGSAANGASNSSSTGSVAQLPATGGAAGMAGNSGNSPLAPLAVVVALLMGGFAVRFGMGRAR